MSAAEARLFDLLAGKHRAQAVSTFAALGLVERLTDAPRSTEELADELGGNTGALESLLEFTAGLGLLERVTQARWALTELGRELAADAHGPLAAYLGAPEQWDPWSRLGESLRSSSGRTPFALTFGADYYEHMEQRADVAARYDLGIDAFTRVEASALCAAHDFSRCRRIVDVGGGRGTLLLELLARWPQLHATLFDRPHVVERAAREPRLRDAERLELVPGDFHRDVPGGHDHLILKHVLHNWDDERAGALLARCAAALPTGGRALVIEAIRMPDERIDLARLLDLEMIVLTGGRVRRKPELRRLFQRAGLTLAALRPVGESWLLVGVRA